MKLYCDYCDAVCDFKPGEVERLVYALSAALSNAESREALDNDSNITVCLTEALCWSYDQEVYSEYVEQCIKGRKAKI